METRAPKSLYYKRVIWLRPTQDKLSPADLTLELLKENIYTFKGIDVVLNIKDLIDLRHTTSVYDYFEELRAIDFADLKTLCIIGYSSDNLIERDIYLSRLTRIWTTFSTAYVNYIQNNLLLGKYRKSFTHLVDNNNTLDKLKAIIQNGKTDEANPF